MDNRFTLKDFIFVCLFVFVIAAIFWTSYQFSYQEGRLNDLQSQLQKLNDNQKEQITTLGQIRDALRQGVKVNSSGPTAGTEPAKPATASDGRIRRKNADGSIYVYYPTPPKSPHDPLVAPDYATGDWLVQNLNDEPKAISPYIPRQYTSQLVQQPVLEAMLSMNPDTFEMEPLLAESYYVSADGLTLRFVLRKEICFSDGVAITADDVVFSYKTIMDPDVDCAPYRGYFENVQSCNKVDPRTIEFKMSKPYFLALQYLGGITIIPQHVYKYNKGAEFNAQGTVLIGSGPYKVDHWDRGQQLVLVRNDKYWSDRASFDKLVFKFIVNPQAAFQLFQNE
jgi:ABC-type transport system substrate-binding protein